MSAGRPPKHLQRMLDDQGRVMDAQEEARRNISLFREPQAYWESKLDALVSLARRMDQAINKAWNEHYYQFNPT